MKPMDFLKKVWDRHPVGCWLFLAAKKEVWKEVPIRNDEGREKAVRRFLKKYPASEYDLYFCPNPFGTDRRLGGNALRTTYAWCDIDDADPEAFDPPQSALWETSPGRFQGLWRFNRTLSEKRAEAISRHLAYEFDGDRNGWTATKHLRIPGTFNHKRPGKCPKVKLHRFEMAPIDPGRLLKKTRNVKACEFDTSLSDFNLDRDPKQLHRKWRKAIRHQKANALLRQTRVTERDRSRQIFIMGTAMFKAKVPIDDIACLLWNSAYFQDKHGPNIAMLEREIQSIAAKVGE